jgi:hypothetical protein
LFYQKILTLNERLWVFRMRYSNVKVVFALFLLTGIMLGCDNGAQQKEKSGPKTDEQNAEGTTEGGEGEGEGEGEGTGDNVGSADVFNDWCEKAEEVATVGSKLKSLYEQMCDNGTATTLMKSTMISKAFTGSGSPKLTNIEPIAGDKTHSTAFFAVGIKLPIDIQKHFEKVGPKAGDEAAQIKLAEANGATAEFEVKDEYKKDGKYHVRGWKVRAKNTKKIAIVSIVTESISRSDQYELNEGNSYMYTQYIVEGIEGVKDFSLLTAGVKTSKGSYLLTTAKIKVGNKGLPELAEGQITTTAKDLIKAMYKAAADVK